LIQVGHVDFIAQPVSDLKRAEEFYGGTLGLMRNPGSGERWVEYETGNLTVALSTFGGTLALRVDDVDAARAKLEGDGVEFAMDTFDSGVCNGAPFSRSRIRTGTGCCCIDATRRPTPGSSRPATSSARTSWASRSPIANVARSSTAAGSGSIGTR
jgi:hypothetical protein